MKKFPDGFLWGAATSSYQIEGGIDNSDWAEAARNGKVPPIGVACDSYNRYEEDFDIAKNLNHNMHRFSIEWARIEPEEGKFDEKEMEHYKKVVRALRERGMEPLVTIWHFSLPSWLSDKGGIEYEKWPDLLARYGAYIAEHLGASATFYITINEPMVVTGVGYFEGTWPPFTRNPFAYFRAVSNVIQGHNKTYQAIKKVNPQAQIGVSKNIVPVEGTNPIGTFFAAISSWWYNNHFLNSTRDFLDFIALNHYFRVVLWQNKKQQQQFPRSDFGWELYPPAIYSALMLLKKYQLPIYVSENGLADADDSRRATFLKGTLECVLKAITDGADVRGYSHWSLLDNYEWAEGFKMRFGLVHVDHAGDRKRTIRESAKAYAEIIKNNALN